MTEQIFNKMPDCVDVEEIFEAILDSTDGDYIIQTQILAAMKPAGWQKVHNSSLRKQFNESCEIYFICKIHKKEEIY